MKFLDIILIAILLAIIVAAMVVSFSDG